MSFFIGKDEPRPPTTAHMREKVPGKDACYGGRERERGGYGGADVVARVRRLARVREVATKEG
ncbi:hypothetical protein V6Z11_D05G377800 [Gossypium hirsutum]